ncbi:MAG: glycoside hydrolase family 108 protein, partial [Guyparkeria sp.]
TDDIIDKIIEREGGYVDHPADRGGCTNYGITLATLRRMRGDDSTDCDDVAALTEDEAREIYAEQYIDEPGFSHVKDQRLFGLLVDSGVQHGPSRAVKWLQDAAGVTADGVYGPVTTRAVNEADPRGLYRRVLARRAEHYGKTIALDPTQSAFAVGWMRRIGEFVEDAP